MFLKVHKEVHRLYLEAQQMYLKVQHLQKLPGTGEIILNNNNKLCQLKGTEVNNFQIRKEFGLEIGEKLL